MVVLESPGWVSLDCISLYAGHHFIVAPNSYPVRFADTNQFRDQNPTFVATTLREIKPIYNYGSIAGDQSPYRLTFLMPVLAYPIPASSTTASGYGGSLATCLKEIGVQDINPGGLNRWVTHHFRRGAENGKEIEDSNPEWIHGRAESLAKGIFRKDRDLSGIGKG